MRKILLGCLIFWVLFIFYQGTRSSSVSIQNSDKIVHQVVDVVEKVTPKSENELYQITHFLVRKSAHLFEYAVLGGLLVAYFNKDFIHSLFGVFLCATLDEYLQSFVGRTSSVEDILIDFGGGFVGIIIISILLREIKNRLNSPY